MKDPQTLIEKYKVIQKLNPSVDIPWEIARFLPGTPKRIDFFIDQISIADGDFGSLDELRNVAKFFVDQLGGTVKWEKK